MLKVLGNPQGPHVLACELVGTRLAEWIGLSTFDYGLVDIRPDDERLLGPLLMAECGPAFVTRYEPGHTWGGQPSELLRLSNHADVNRLVVFDTWTRNCDRHAPPARGRKPNLGNVFIADSRDGPRLTAIDHTHCFTCGEPLTLTIAHIERIREEGVYGLFDGFVGLMKQPLVAGAASRLASFSEQDGAACVEGIPSAWEVNPSVREALADFLCQRAQFVAANIENWLEPTCWPQLGLFA